MYMPIYDNEILKDNIEKLQKDNGLNQESFAKKAGISQSRLSKLLGSDEGARFSIEQVCNIANEFNVSIDYLVTGKEPKVINSTRKICEILVQLFEDYYLKHTDFSREEEIQQVIYSYQDGYNIPDIECSKKEIKYNALFFSQCWYPNPNRDYTDDELDSLRDEAYQSGNELIHSIEINKFLNAFIPIFELYDAAKMPNEAYKYTVQSLLDNVPK